MEIVPFDKREGFIWYNGELVNWPDAKTHVLNHGLHYASCVFEGERVYDDAIFKITEHSVRLHNSAKMLGFEIPYSVAELDAAKNLIVKTQNVKNGYVRAFAWRGSEKMAISAQNNKIHTAIATWEWPPYYAAQLHDKGIALTLAKFKRPAPDTAPTAAKAAGLYMICTISKHEAERNGFNDALMLDYRGYIAEATGANIFMVIDGKLHTPIADCFLNGITRQTVIALAKENGIEVVERHIKLEELAKASEVFLTGTAAELTPVGSVDEYKFTPGKVTSTLKEAYHSLVRRK